MFRHRHRPPAFSEFLNWTDYRWEPSATSAPGTPRPRGWQAPYRRGFSLLQVFLAGLAVIVGLKLMTQLRNRGNRSLIEKRILAVLLVVVASYISKRRQRL
jgi:hypothetical protein